jgi:hypothetical protein
LYVAPFFAAQQHQKLLAANPTEQVTGTLFQLTERNGRTMEWGACNPAFQPIQKMAATVGADFSADRGGTFS